MPKCILNPCLHLLVEMVTKIKTYEQTVFKSLLTCKSWVNRNKKAAAGTAGLHHGSPARVLSSPATRWPVGSQRSAGAWRETDPYAIRLDTTLPWSL